MRTLPILALVVSVMVLTAPMVFGDPEFDSLLDRSPIVVVAEPVYNELGIAFGRLSEVTLWKFGVRFKVNRVLKSGGSINDGDEIFTRLAILIDDSIGDLLQSGKKQKMILFLRKIKSERNSYENTSAWFGVQGHTKGRELVIDMEVKMAKGRDKSKKAAEAGKKNQLAGTHQPATAPDSKSEDNKKPEPESERRSQ